MIYYTSHRRNFFFGIKNDYIVMSIAIFLFFNMILVFPMKNSAASQNETAILRDIPKGMIGLYQENRKKGIPNYITEDFILLSHAMVINQSITMMEQDLILPAFKELMDSLITIYRENEAQQEILNYLLVIQNLLDGKGVQDKEEIKQSGRETEDNNPSETQKMSAKGTTSIPPEVEKELEKIRAAQGIYFSDIMQQKMDYTQFMVRGKYTMTQELSAYFQAMKYAGVALFPVVASKSTGITSSQADLLTSCAVSMIKTINSSDQLQTAYQQLLDTLKLIFGPVDDLVFQDYLHVIENSLQYDNNKELNITNLRENLLKHATKNNKKPSIISGIVDINRLEKGRTAQDVMTGFRFMPSRYTPDSAAMQQLVFHNVKDYLGEKKPFTMGSINGKAVKAFPMGAEIMALLGSTEAVKILIKNDETNYQNYGDAGKNAEQFLTSPTSVVSNIPFINLEIIRKWLAAPEDSLNSIDKTEVIDAKRRLNSSLGFWTFNRYINMLYAKQSYTSMAKSFSMTLERDWAWLAPATSLYINLEKQILDLKKIIEGKSEFSATLDQYVVILGECMDIAQKETENKPLNDRDINFLNNLDRQIKNITKFSDSPIVVDVHTEPNSGMVLEEALGYPKEIFREKGGKKARGVLFNYFEFKYPMEKRLNDSQWQKLLEARDLKLILSPASTSMAMP
ncbi:hypothetical protein MTBBW1_1020012 [Desulfamplus magnetovallimortis]|uniref:Uncharacterized protein n=1 Tax=Desulfamplus magnetovallimortis TaxID=1246637 RepID=A0A1W1H544_9BACT|nr:DUF3160 domain-containing protein [Desulfamplus magnetovallimortis]SLM27488.1 hypothetical protein MTBBW1_1020012 [Desulfamplus magnetovallimortis]